MVLSIGVLLMLILALLSALDLNRFKPWINDRVSEATGRTFAINGDLSFTWERPKEPQAGWRRIVPWPHFRANDIVLGNPEWAKTGPYMAQVQQIDFTMNPLPLLRRRISVSSLILTEPRLALERDKEGRNNWTFKKDEESKSDWQFNIDDLKLTKGNVRYVDPVMRADAEARIDTETEGEHKGNITWKLGGKFNGEKVSGDGVAGALLSLQKAGVRYPLEAELNVGKTTINVDGTFTNPTQLSELDVNLKIKGASMAQLFPLTGILLPETPKFSTEGRIVGHVVKDRIDLRYEKFQGKVGSSDIGGTLEYKQQEPRPILRGEVSSDYLNLKDLGALLAADSPEEQKKRGIISKQPPDKAIPVATFKTDRWRKIDVQVQFSGKKIIRSEELPIDNLFTKVKLDDGVLSLAPLNFGVAGGRLTTELEIDSRNEPAKAKVNVAARRIKLKQLFPKVEEMEASVGEINGDAKLTSAGNSLSELLGSANGEVKSMINQGSISKFILEAIGLNVGSAVAAKLFGDHQVKLNCMATDFKVTNGLMETRVFVIDTEDATIYVDGDINLAKETIGLTIQPQSKGIRIISLRSPLYVKGTFKNPDVGVDKGVVALKAGAAAALGALAAPLAALLPLVNPGPEEGSPCGQLVAEAGKKPVAPSPEQEAAKKKNGKK